MSMGEVERIGWDGHTFQRGAEPDLAMMAALSHMDYGWRDDWELANEVGPSIHPRYQDGWRRELLAGVGNSVTRALDCPLAFTYRRWRKAPDYTREHSWLLMECDEPGHGVFYGTMYDPGMLPTTLAEQGEEG